MQDKYALQLILPTAWWLHVTIKQGHFAAIKLRDIQGGILVVQHHLSQLFKIGFMLKTELIFGECQNSLPGDHNQSEKKRTHHLIILGTYPSRDHAISFPGADTRSSGALPPKSFQLFMEMFLFLSVVFRLFSHTFPVTKMSFPIFPKIFPKISQKIPQIFPEISHRSPARRHSVLPQASHHDVTLLAHGHEDQDARGVRGSAKHLEAAEVEMFFL